MAKLLTPSVVFGGPVSVIVIYYGDPYLCSIPHYLLFSPEILLLGEYVRIVKENGGGIIIVLQPFEDGCRARCAAGV
jgi:hypothetical protein